MISLILCVAPFLLFACIFIFASYEARWVLIKNPPHCSTARGVLYYPIVMIAIMIMISSTIIGDELALVLMVLYIAFVFNCIEGTNSAF